MLEVYTFRCHHTPYSYECLEVAVKQIELLLLVVIGKRGLQHLAESSALAGGGAGDLGDRNGAWVVLAEMDCV
jgi:hypothetical protein